ncbi:DUF4919 domain-containing protein [Flavobacterium sp. A45]|uniref:DUF4919 domain-containing protein n=1 Tax=Flavobacterium sp. A45 TaxID=1945862 RepID=UPI0009861AF4|nr:DUF4919 domain-containing protein [Flavobacterium sp. A45]OOG71593.1 hypothetical protein B0E44_09785 [Flavobacterium sp. A45]
MKNTFLLILTFLSIISFAQDPEFRKPNYDEIKKEIKDANSVYYYPKLKQKFDSADFTMSMEEKRHLYYGFVFQDDYSAEYTSKNRDKFIEILQKKELNEIDYDQIISYGDSILKTSPFDLRVLNYQNIAFDKRGITNRMISSSSQIRIITNAILSSGDGLTKESAFYVTTISHEYDILNIIGFEFGGSQSLIKTYDYLTVKENEDKIKGLYFDISPSLAKLDINFSTETFKKEDLIGTWKIINVLEKSQNKYLAELIKGFEVSSLIFNQDNTFHFKSTNKSRGILEFTKMMGTSNWIYDPNKNLIKIGTKKDHYSVMGFKFVQKEGKTFFVIEDTDMKLTFEVQKT